VRGSLILITLLFTVLRDQTGIINAGLIVGTLTIAIAFVSLWQLEETYGKDLDYVEPSGGTGL